MIGEHSRFDAEKIRHEAYILYDETAVVAAQKAIYEQLLSK